MIYKSLYFMVLTVILNASISQFKEHKIIRQWYF